VRGLDARDDIVAKTDLFVECAGPRQHFARDKIHEQHNYGGGAHVHGKRGVAPAGHKRKQRLMRVRNGDLKRLAELRPMLDARTRRNVDARRASVSRTRQAWTVAGALPRFAIVRQQRTFAQFHFAAATESALAAARVQRQPVRREHIGQ
jgi:hypothetical protein